MIPLTQQFLPTIYARRTGVKDSFCRVWQSGLRQTGKCHMLDKHSERATMHAKSNKHAIVPREIPRLELRTQNVAIERNEILPG